MNLVNSEEDGVMLASVAITQILEPMGWQPFSDFLKQNDGAIMPSMPLSMFLQLLKDDVKFSVDGSKHG